MNWWEISFWIIYRLQIIKCKKYTKNMTSMRKFKEETTNQWSKSKSTFSPNVIVNLDWRECWCWCGPNVVSNCVDVAYCAKIEILSWHDYGGLWWRCTKRLVCQILLVITHVRERVSTTANPLALYRQYNCYLLLNSNSMISANTARSIQFIDFR